MAGECGGAAAPREDETPQLAETQRADDGEPRAAAQGGDGGADDAHAPQPAHRERQGAGGPAVGLLRLISRPIAPAFQLLQAPFAAAGRSADAAAAAPGGVRASDVELVLSSRRGAHGADAGDPPGTDAVHGDGSARCAAAAVGPRRRRVALMLQRGVVDLNERYASYLTYERQHRYHMDNVRTFFNFRPFRSGAWYGLLASSSSAARAGGGSGGGGSGSGGGGGADGDAEDADAMSGGWCDYCGKQVFFETHLRRCRCKKLWFCKSKCRRKAWDFHGQCCRYCASFASFSAEDDDDDDDDASASPSGGRRAEPHGARRASAEPPTAAGEGRGAAAAEQSRATAAAGPGGARSEARAAGRTGRFVRVASGRYMLAERVRRDDGSGADGERAAERAHCGAAADAGADRRYVGGMDFYETGLEMTTWAGIEPSHARAERVRQSEGAPRAQAERGRGAAAGAAIDLLIISSMPASPSPMVSSFLAKDRRGVVHVLSFYSGTVPRELCAASAAAAAGGGAYGPRPNQRQPRNWLSLRGRGEGGPGRARRAPAAAQGRVVVRWYNPHLEVMLDGSRGAKIDCARDAANMRVMRLIGHREEDADPGRPKSP